MALTKIQIFGNAIEISGKSLGNYNYKLLILAQIKFLCNRSLALMT